MPYAKITGLSSIVGLVQMGVLEIHPWGSRADDPEMPDRLIFDLDPDPELPWKTVTTTALLIRSELDHLGLESGLKTTGGKGLHVMVPVQRRQTWTEARDFTKAFVDHIVSLEPRLFTASMRKADRGGKIFIDYVRNTRGATAVAAYSARARPGAPVSVPLYWDEVESAMPRPEFTAYCAIRKVLSTGGQPDTDLMPDGTRGERWDETAASRAVTPGAATSAGRSSNRRFLVVEDSPIFAKFACNTIQYIYPDAEVIECHTYADAARELRTGSFKLVVSGFGLDGGKTAYDIRELSDAPMILLTGRPDRDTQGLGTATMVHKGAGSDAMRAAITGLLGA